MDISDNKRIAFNSAVLYTKLIVTTIIGLYTSRIVLQALGASDYGLYNLIGGVVTMMNFVGVSMVAVSNRYLLVEIGKGDKGDSRKVFNTSLIIHIVLAILLIIIGETVGVYYVEHVANIIPEKVGDALYVLHLSIFACVFNIIYIPYSGLIMAREKFVFTSFVEIGRSFLQLILVLWLANYMGNRLQMYANIMAIFSVILCVCMIAYCYVKDRQIIRWRFNRTWSDYVDMMKFAFWMMIGALATIGQVQGANMVVNIFYGTIMNAAYGIANQVNNYVMMFVRSFNQAAVPQIMKNQGSNESRSVQLVYTTTRVSFLILLLPAIPFLLNIKFVLSAWLGEVPEYTDIFILILICTSMIRCLGAGFDSAIQATGKVKVNQIVYSFAYLAVLPISYWLYSIGLPVNTINILIMLTALGVLMFQVHYMTIITAFTINGYLSQTIKPCITTLVAILPLFVMQQFLDDSFQGFLISASISLFWILAMVYYCGLTKYEREKVGDVIKKVVNNITKK